jgi:glutamine cyclotransferase
VKHRRHAWRALLLLLLLLLSGSGTLSAADTPPVPVYGYEVLERRAQPRENFVQGLEFFADRLYVGTGLRGQSRLREYRFEDMTLLREQRLPEAYFGEGITRLGERLYQLTWRAGKVLVYDAERWLPLREGALATEGWGITNDGQRLIYSDGSDRLRFLDPDTLAVGKTLAVTLRGRPLPRLNELEWIDGEIWANVWTSNQLVRIDPDSGAVTGIVDLSGLLAAEDRRGDEDVLNGIAWNAAARQLWVTGKRWPWLYRVDLHLRGYLGDRPGTTGARTPGPAQSR